MSSAHPTLRHGEFFGFDTSHRDAGGFALAVKTPALAPERVPTHTHESASFVVPLAGIYLSSARGAGAELDRPALIYSPPGTTHRDRFRHNDGARFLTISVADEVFRNVADDVRLPEAATSFRRPDLLLIAHRLVRDCVRWTPASALRAEALCLELMGNTAREPQPRSGQPPLWLAHAKELLREQPLRVTAAAQLLGIHPVQFVRTFRRFVHCTPGDFIRRARVEKAAALLRETTLSLAEVALRAGFADQSHFSKVFRRLFGVPPGAYRVQNRQDPAARVM